MKGIYFDLNLGKVVLKKLHLAGRFNMLMYKEDWPLPKIKYPNQVLVKTKLAGICASDLHQIDVNISYAASILANKVNPYPMGHEVLGIVEKIGSEVTGLKKGQRVILNPVPHCETYGFESCESCKNGNWEQCYCLVGIGDGSPLEDKYGGRKKFGGFSGGGFEEYFTGFEKQFYIVPENMSDEIAVLAEPLSVGIHAVARNPPQDNQTILVIGAGIIGLMVIAAIRALGSKCKIICLARYSFQAEIAKKLGADEIISERDTNMLYEKVAIATNGILFKPTLGKKIVYGDLGPDMIFDCVATESSMDDSLHLVKSNGKIVIVGMGYSITKKIDWSIQSYKEVDIIGSAMHGISEINGEKKDPFMAALEILSKDPEKFSSLVTQSFPIEKYKEAFNQASHKSRNKDIKVIFDYSLSS